MTDMNDLIRQARPSSPSAQDTISRLFGKPTKEEEPIEQAVSGDPLTDALERAADAEARARLAEEAASGHVTAEFSEDGKRLHGSAGQGPRGTAAKPPQTLSALIRAQAALNRTRGGGELGEVPTVAVLPELDRRNHSSYFPDDRSQ